jgi:hypothetical protein
MTQEQFSEWLDHEIGYAQGFIDHGPLDLKKKSYWEIRVEAFKEVKDTFDKVEQPAEDKQIV